MNKLFIVSGPSGSGKTTIMRSLMNNEIISFTTRPKRRNEVDGKDYIFITKEQFHKLLNSNGLIEHTEYGGNYYGVTKEEFENKLNKGDAFFIADYNGMKQVKQIYPYCETIFIYVKKEDAERNMRERGDSEEFIQKRLSTYEDEIDNLIYYDHVVVNNYNELEETIEKVRLIIQGG